MDEIKMKVSCKELDGSVSKAEVTIESDNDVSAETSSDPGEMQEKLVSGENIKTINNEDILGSGNLSIEGGGFKSFSSSWPTTDTTAAFCAAINADTDAVIGNAYLGGATFSDLPFNGNGDIVVEILQGPQTNSKSIHLILTSGTNSPYHWEYTYWETSGIPHNSGWIHATLVYRHEISFVVAGEAEDTNYKFV